jgi:hypothetical protein
MAENALELMVEEVRLEYRKLKEQADKALAQVDDAAFFGAVDQDANSLAVIVKHVGNNLRSRWTDFYDSDGEKPDRRRDEEFEIRPGETRQTIEAIWSRGWERVLAVLDGMRPADLDRTVVIRAEPHTVPRAVLRSLTHTAGHIGQIVLLAKHARGAQWTTLSIPKGQSEQFNAKMREKYGTAR